MTKTETRPLPVTALSAFFIFGATVSFVSLLSLVFRGSFLEPIWRLNPRALEGFTTMGRWAILLMSVVSVACASAAVGLWRGARWGYWLAVVLLAVNLVGDIANVVLGTEGRAVVGIPIVLAILALLMTKRVKSFFKNFETKNRIYPSESSR